MGGFIKSCRLPEGDPFGRVTMTFGSQGFFAYGATSQSKPSNSAKVSPQPGAEAVWWSTYSIEPPPDTRNFDKEDARRQLENRHSNWKDPVIRSIVADANIDSVYPTWTTPNLPSWGRNGVVLIGDAAHALQPSSGQGASQALEDAQAFCILLSHYIGKSASQDEGIDATIRTYYTLRQPRVKRIADSAKYRGDMKRKKSFVGEWITYLFIWLLCRLFLSSFPPDLIPH